MMISVENLVFHHPRSTFTLRVPSLRVGKGERVALTGPSGAGKTTLLNLIAGVLLADQGVIRVGGVEPARLGQAGRRAFRVRTLGLVFQDFQLLEYLGVGENILLPCRINPALKPGPAARERARELARRTGIEHRWEHRPARLSQGEQQRVALCRALVARPPCVLADEPTGSLDLATKTRVVDLLLEECAQTGASLLMVTHDPALPARFDRTISLGEGG